MRKVSRAEDFQPWTNYLSVDNSIIVTAKDKDGGDKTFKPPQGVQSAAKHALQLIEDGKAGDGFTSVGRGRAHQLANGEAVSMTVIKKMHSYFARHNVDKQGKGWGKDSPGYVAWLAWGGDAGRKWVNGIMRDHGDKDKESQKKEAGAWPSNPEWEEHLGNLRELHTHILNGIEWHNKHNQIGQLNAHEVAAEAVQHAMDAVRNVMRFPDATQD